MKQALKEILGLDAAGFWKAKNLPAIQGLVHLSSHI